jgi:hypothetical protein
MVFIKALFTRNRGSASFTSVGEIYPIDIYVTSPYACSILEGEGNGCKIVPLGDTVLPIESSVKEFQPFWGRDPRTLEKQSLEEWGKWSHQKWVYVYMDVSVFHRRGHGSRRCLLLIKVKNLRSEDFSTTILDLATFGPRFPKVLSSTLDIGDVSGSSTSMSLDGLCVDHTHNYY